MNFMPKLLVFFSVCFFFSCQPTEQKITLKNASETSLDTYLIPIAKSVFENVAENQLPLLTDKEGQTVPAQFDDLDGDGSWDELVLECTLKAGEAVSFTYEWIPANEYPSFKQKANVYLGYSAGRDGNFVSVSENERPEDHEAMSTPYLYQYEGPGWESELVAFRSYFDSRNGKDIFGKTSPRLYVDSIGINENYHELQEWGMDVLKVGASLGAGALGMLKNDSIYRLGDTPEASFQIIADGPLRAIFRLTYGGWDVNGTAYELEETITIWGSKRWYESAVRLKGGSGKDTLVTGIVNLKGIEPAGLVSPGWKILSAHGKQGENQDYLGMGLLVPEANFAGFTQAPKEGNGVTNTHTAYLMPSGDAYRFVFYAGWEGESQKFTDQKYFEEQLLTEALQLEGSVDVEIGRN